MTRATGGVEPFPFKTAPRKGLIVQAGPSLPQTRTPLSSLWLEARGIQRRRSDDYMLPHFHAFYGENKVIISVDRAEFPSAKLKLVRKWAKS